MPRTQWIAFPAGYRRLLAFSHQLTFSTTASLATQKSMPPIMPHRIALPLTTENSTKRAGSGYPITDPKRLEEIAREISPVSHVSPDDPPTLIIHGDQDRLVPLQQSELIVEKLKKAGVEDESGGQERRRTWLAWDRQGREPASSTGLTSTSRKSAKIKFGNKHNQK